MTRPARVALVGAVVAILVVITILGFTGNARLWTFLPLLELAGA